MPFSAVSTFSYSFQKEYIHIQSVGKILQNIYDVVKVIITVS